MGRPRANIDEERVADLAYKGASNRDIAAVLGCDHKTIASRFSPILEKRRADRRIALKEAQLMAAIGGNATMLIWLGKNELDQTDKPVSAENPPDDAATDADGNKIDP